MVEAAQVFAQQASGAGVNVELQEARLGHVLRPQLPQVGLRQDFWATRNYLPQVAAGQPAQLALQRDATGATTRKWPVGSYKRGQGRAESTRPSAASSSSEMQKIEYDSGGYIIWCFYNLIDAYSAKVTGFGQAKTTTR